MRTLARIEGFVERVARHFELRARIGEARVVRLVGELLVGIVVVVDVAGIEAQREHAAARER